MRGEAMLSKRGDHCSYQPYGLIAYCINLLQLYSRGLGLQDEVS